MKKQFLTLLVFALTAVCFGQVDTIFSNNNKIPCVVKEITEDAVKYSFQGEDLVNAIYKNSVQKIIFKSGRVQTFAEATSFKAVNGVDDYENVTITAVENEIKGLFKIGDLSSKAKGTTTLSNQERVKERAFRKIKIEAAMMGANIIYISNQRTEGNKAGSYFTSAQSAETNLTGVAYTNQLPSIDEFKKIIGDKKNFTAIEEAKLWSNASDMSKTSTQNNFVINSITNDNGLIMISGDLQGESKYKSFRVVRFDKDNFYIFYEDKSTSYNIKVRL